MITCNFAPNEQWDDAWVSFKLLFQPWRWKNGEELEIVKKQILRQFRISNFEFRIFLFLTGRSALYTILKSLNLPKGSEVIVQAFTCEAVILPILACGLKPVYVDIETKSFSINPIDLQKKITDKARALILQYSFSITPVYKDEILSLVSKHKLLLIEDIAHGYSNQEISNFKFQISNSIFLMSFGRSKAISSVFGGAIATNNLAVIKQLSNSQASLSMPSWLFIFRLLLYKSVSMLIKSTYDLIIGKIIHKIINTFHLIIPEITNNEKGGEFDQTLNKAYPNALAILLLHQLNKYERMQKNRAQITAFYNKNYKLQITNNKSISNFEFRISNYPLLRYPLLVTNRDLILQKAAKNNIFLGKWYDQVVAPKSLNLKKVGYTKGSCLVAEKICQQIINLPTNINRQEAEKVINILNDV